MSVRHFGEQKGKGSSSDKEEGETEPEIKKPEYKKKKKPKNKQTKKKKLEYITGTVEVAPEELTDHNTLTSVGGAHKAYTLANAGPGPAPVWPGSARPPAADPEAQVTVDSKDPGTSPGPPGVPHRMGRPASLLRLFATSTPTTLVASAVSATATPTATSYCTCSLYQCLLPGGPVVTPS
ncbi:uncharacterized protein LOC105061924 isoform X2 [Camelus bactrianus]|uniref:Uncharacterized protein LOC105061924 isoform X2 n=1 Tax=Camelus bactrianus TaxID=9837 RepID=A0AC58PFA4_CAMBA